MINKLISESSDYDFKVVLETEKPKSWLKSVSGFANGIGGCIYFGVADENTIIGLDNPKETSEQVTDFIKKHIIPNPIYYLNPIEINNKIILELKVLPGESTPYYYCNNGNKIAFIRSGSSTIECPSYILNELILKGSGKTYDSVLTGYKKSDFSFSILENEFLKRTNTNFSLQDYISFGLMNKDGYLTNAGILLADENPYRHSRIFCTSWNGVNKINEFEVNDDKEFYGSLIKLLHQALDFFDVNTKIKWKKTETETVYYPDYSREAILEALVNGLIHRNYNNLGAEVCLNIYEDRIEITSPGLMASGESLPEIIDFPMESIRRNPIIADVFWRMGYMNRRGSGLSKISSATNSLFNDGKSHVKFIARNSCFVVIIENANYKVSKNNEILKLLTNRQIDIYNLIKENNGISITAIAKKLNFNRKTISSDLTLLIENSLIYSTGNTKTKLWFISQ